MKISLIMLLITIIIIILFAVNLYLQSKCDEDPYKKSKIQSRHKMLRILLIISVIITAITFILGF